jgi:hypothetical protein
MRSPEFELQPLYITIFLPIESCSRRRLWTNLQCIKLYSESCWLNIFWGIYRWLVEIIHMPDIYVVNFPSLLHHMRVSVKRYNIMMGQFLFLFLFISTMYLNLSLWLKYSVTAMYVIQLLLVSTGPILMTHIVMLIVTGRRRGMRISCFAEEKAH